MVGRNCASGATCRDFERDLVLYYYGECNRTERNRVEAHLKSCASCHLFLDDLRTLLSLTVSLDEPPQSFWESYLREMQTKLAAVSIR
jgi:predicted anti-sigma-YlaC factor YlaD